MIRFVFYRFGGKSNSKLKVLDISKVVGSQKESMGEGTKVGTGDNPSR